ncbi:Glutarate-semialdehyde dehydrogenase [Paraburkholderia sediminicola]|uniref:Glutarate-semialdehyde dehydrogenase n=1 Tax=Paraburkholderia sediminicola TaxID=458836 RepID=A0A6J5CU56_9BURK|nr:NAD-dependent succinate-semialdehyde dehydrogenase [Paraburkholderia sediminicola]CAB3743797.1 Glutarate-semialdehyde dehydrogenase [Paraburkholderia sediminicola]
MFKLTRSDLFREAAYVGGQWSTGNSDAYMEIRNPATGEVVGRVPSLSREEVREAILLADHAFQDFRRWTGKARGAVLRKWAALMLENKDDLAQIMTAEQGKPLAEARGEIDYAASFLDWFGEEAKRVYGETIPAPRDNQRITVIRQPVGVCAAITPWNFPSGMVTRKVAPAIASGCTVLLKPAPQTPFSALALCVLAEEAGLPKGVLSVLTGDAVEIGGEIIRSETVRKLSFTGSTPVGKKLMAECAGTVKKVSLELGGNAPFIVFDDADVESAVQGAIASKFRNAGQTCVCANRFFVQHGIYDAFVNKLTEVVKGMRMGRGTEEGVTLGPLIDSNAFSKVSRLVDEARSKGATVLTGGTQHPAGAQFFAPTVVTDVTNDMTIANEEIFGPVVSITRFSDEQEAVALANSTRYGLAAYFYTSDLNRSVRISEALDFGIVGINEGAVSTEVAPFGGFKESGFGKEGSKHGIDEYSERKYICLGNVR